MLYFEIEKSITIFFFLFLIENSTLKIENLVWSKNKIFTRFWLENLLFGFLQDFFCVCTNRCHFVANSLIRKSIRSKLILGYLLQTCICMKFLALIITVFAKNVSTLISQRKIKTNFNYENYTFNQIIVEVSPATKLRIQLKIDS